MSSDEKQLLRAHSLAKWKEEYVLVDHLPQGHTQKVERCIVNYDETGKPIIVALIPAAPQPQPKKKECALKYCAPTWVDRVGMAEGTF